MERSIGLHSGLWASSSVAYPLQVSQRVLSLWLLHGHAALETEVEVPEIMPQNLVKMVPRQTLPPRWHVKVAHLSTVRSLLQGSGV